MRTRLASLIAVAALAACSTNDTDGASDTSAQPDTTVATTAPAPATDPDQASTTVTPPATDPAPTTTEIELTASSPGVTAEEITIGISYVDLDAVREFVDLDHGDYEATYTALIDDINARGGVLGRKLVPVFAKVSPINADTADAACLQLTEDTETFAVLGFAQDDAVLCYVEDHATPFIGGVQNTARLEASAAPWITIDPNADLIATRAIEALAAAGTFEGAQVAVVVNPTDGALLDDVVVPTLEAAGVEVVSTAVLDDTGGDVVATEANVKVVAERFRADGATTVVAAGSVFLPFANGLAKTDFRPTLVGTDLNSMNGWAKDPANDLSLVTTAVGAGPETLAFEESAYAACADVIEATQPGVDVSALPADPNAPTPHVSAVFACRYLALFVAIATAAGPDLTPETFGAAAAALGEFQLPAELVARTYDAEMSDGSPAVFGYRLDEALREFVADDRPLVG